VLSRLRPEANSSRSVRDVLVATAQLPLLLVIWGKRLGKSASTIAQTKVRARICRTIGIIRRQERRDDTRAERRLEDRKF
jgi:hypothetical protein